MLRSIRKEDISTKVADCKQDTKKLYTLVNRIVGHTSENSMPKHDSDDQLAEEFANYFIDKIKKDQIQSRTTPQTYTISKGGGVIL